MRSPRSRLESACRIAAFALIGWLLGTSIMPRRVRRVERASDDVASKLAAWTRSEPNTALHADLRATPEPWVVDWLAALSHSARAVSWSGSPPASAVVVDAVPDPRGGIRIDVAGPPNAKVIIRDAAGTIDSTAIAGVGATITASAFVDSVVATIGMQTVRAKPPRPRLIRPVVVVGMAGWEGKFIVAALEERGWPVIARFRVAPKVDVEQPLPPIDTARVSAVIAIDSSVADLAPAIEHFVKSGGGLVVAGSAARALTPLVPGELGTRTRPAVGPSDTIGLGTTGFYPVANLKSDAIVLERRSGGVALAALRIAAGRVVQTGFDDTWRWRLAGNATSEIDHRLWWSRLVGSVAYLPADSVAERTDDAPLARLVDRLGPAKAAPVAERTIDPRIFAILIMILLLTEWASRRLRGAR